MVNEILAAAGVGKSSEVAALQNTAGAAFSESFPVEEAVKIFDRGIKNYGLSPAVGSEELYICDPSQPITDPQTGARLPKIVSEGMSWWLLLSARMAAVVPKKSAESQKIFDGLLAGTNKMEALAKKAGSPGEFPAWKVTIKNGQAVLAPDPNQENPFNSAADADLDLIKSLIYAQDNVDKNIWTDKKYGARAMSLIQHAAKALFTEENGVLILNPSEDWKGLNFTDYMSPATFKEIAEFCRKNGQTALAATWDKAATDSMKLYSASLKDTGEFPAQIQFSVKSPQNIAARSQNNTHQTYDGIRSPWHIGEYAGGFPALTEEMTFGQQAFEAGRRKNFSFTYDRSADKAMYLPLARALGKTSEVKQFTRDILAALPPDSKYFENTLVLLGLMATHYPAKSASNPLPAGMVNPVTIPDGPASETPVKPAVSPEAAKKQPLDFPARSAWATNPGRILSGAGKTSGNILKLESLSTKDETIGFKLASSEAEKFKYLVVTVKNSTGEFMWGGKMFQIQNNGQAIIPKKATGLSVADKYVEQGFEGDIYFPLSSSLGELQISIAKMADVNMELEFSLAN